MDDSQLKTILEGQRQEYQRYLGVVAEGFQSNLKLLAESLGGLQKQLVSLRDMVAKNAEDIEVMKLEIMGMRKDLEIVKVDIGFIKTSLKKKVDTDEFFALEKRVAMLEKHR